MSLNAVEDALLEKLRTVFDQRLRSIEAMPAELSAEQLKRVVTVTPGAYVAFLGGRPDQRALGRLVASWGVYLVASNAGGAEARRRGRGQAIGAFEMLAVAYGALDGFAPVGLGTLHPQRVTSLSAEAFARRGLTAFGIVIDISLALADLAPADLAPFRTFHADWDIPPIGNVEPPLPASAPDAADSVTLPQE